MSPRKLTDEDKQEILKLYRETEETTSTLADRYGVSSSTVSRFLKSHLTHFEYEELIQQKRLARTPKYSDRIEELPLAPVESPIVPVESPVVVEKPLPVKVAEPSAPTQEKEKASVAVAQEWEMPQPKAEEFYSNESVATVGEVAALGEIVGEDLVDLEDDEDDLDEDDYEDWEDEEVEVDYKPSVATKVNVQVLPLSAASFPKTCYLVIDRAAELITRPLKDFADLGKIPSEEFQQRTLPVFDNHRVARRFSNRSQRVIKVPDGRMLQKTRFYLNAKGITRLLIDGQIYSLS
jgi:transposase-like protein